MSRCCALALLAVMMACTEAPAQMTQDQAAELLLNSARKAFNEKEYAFAQARFREFLARFGGHRDAPAARYGLALTLLEGTQKNHTEARDLLQGLAGDKTRPDYPSILYYLGLAHRGLGVAEVIAASAKPAEAPQRQVVAQKHFDEAARHFGAAAPAFAARAPKVPDGKQPLPEDWEWAARARCDHAEMLLRLQRSKEARAAAADFLKDPTLARSRYRDLARYHLGFAAFLEKDYPETEKTLSALAPFEDPDFGTHARYLLARIHHLADERAEAAHHYESVLVDHEKHRKAAQEALKRPDLLQKVPVEKERAEALLKGPAPDHVARSGFYLAVLQYEAGRFAEARGRLAEFLKAHAGSPLTAEAQLRLGFCMVQQKEFAEAVKLLAALAQQEPRLADQALFWLGKARAGAAPDAATNPNGHLQAVREALDTMRQAADRAGQLAANDPEAKRRRADILLEIADTQHAVKQHREAATIYAQLLTEKALPQRDEELHQRHATALHLAGDYNESDAACQRFFKQFPRSTLTPAVLFRHAENSWFRLLAAEKHPNPAERAKAVAALCDETARRYREVIDRYPEFPRVSLARYGLAMSLYRKGDLEKAQDAFAAIPDADRAGELEAVPYLLADCLMRLTPTTVPEDALETGKLEAKLKSAAALLEGFASTRPGSPLLPDALLRLGHCWQRLAALQAGAEERRKLLLAARAALDQLLAKTPPGHPTHAQGHLEWAKCAAQLGEVTQAAERLRRFTADPLRHTPPAPLALVQLATLLRGQNKAAEAGNVLAKAREQYESQLIKDPERADWVALLRYHHGAALREAGKLSEARAVFDLVVKQSAGRPEAAEAALRWAQCLKEEGAQRIATGAKLQAAAKKPEDLVAAEKTRDEGAKLVRDAVAYLEGQATQRKQDAKAEVLARMHYEAAWGHRELAAAEVTSARLALAREALKKLGPAAEKFGLPDVPLAKVPLQPAEKAARAAYRRLIDDYPEATLGTDARFELAEMLGDRGEHAAALQLLTDALEREPPPELADRVRLRLGAAQFAAGNLKAALAQFNAVAQRPKSPLAGEAHYRAGECLLKTKDHAAAVERLKVFRDVPQFQQVPGLTDRALLRLGHAYAHLQQWEPSRQAHEQAAARFPTGPWVHEARYGMAWALQQMKQYDQAVNVYAQVTGATVTETAAKAQLQIGLCRLEQKRYADAAAALLAVPFTYDYPDYSAPALLEAARCFVELKQPEQAERLLRRVLRDFEQTPWAEAARGRLERLMGK